MGEGKTFAFSVPLLPTSIMVTDPVCLEYILKHKAHNFIKGPRFYKVGIKPDQVLQDVFGLTCRIDCMTQLTSTEDANSSSATRSMLTQSYGMISSLLCSWLTL